MFQEETVCKDLETNIESMFIGVSEDSAASTEDPPPEPQYNESNEPTEWD